MMLAPLVVIAVCCILPNATSGYKFYLTDVRHASYPNQCYAPVSKIAVTRGFKLYEGCRKWTCDDHYTMTKEGCDDVKQKPGCKVIVDSSKKYPDCCAQNCC